MIFHLITNTGFIWQIYIHTDLLRHLSWYLLTIFHMPLFYTNYESCSTATQNNSTLLVLFTITPFYFSLTFKNFNMLTNSGMLFKSVFYVFGFQYLNHLQNWFCWCLRNSKSEINLISKQNTKLTSSKAVIVRCYCNIIIGPKYDMDE